MVRLTFQCPRCPSVIGFPVTHGQLGRTYELSHPGCSGTLVVVIPLNTLELPTMAPQSSEAEDPFAGVGGLFGAISDLFDPNKKR